MDWVAVSVKCNDLRQFVQHYRQVMPFKKLILAL